MYTIIKTPAGDILRRDADGAFIPADPANLDWQAYQAWLNAGNEPAESSAGDRPSPSGAILRT